MSHQSIEHLRLSITIQLGSRPLDVIQGVTLQLVPAHKLLEHKFVVSSKVCLSLMEQLDVILVGRHLRLSIMTQLGLGPLEIISGVTLQLVPAQKLLKHKFVMSSNISIGWQGGKSPKQERGKSREKFLLHRASAGTGFRQKYSPDFHLIPQNLHGYLCILRLLCFLCRSDL